MRLRYAPAHGDWIDPVIVNDANALTCDLLFGERTR